MEEEKTEGDDPNPIKNGWKILILITRKFSLKITH
jgi:hypothetical protein